MNNEATGKVIAKKKGLSRIWSAFGNSIAGLRFAVSCETAFKQELICFIILLPALILMPLSTSFKAILLMANSLVLVTELVNSSLESIVDLASPDHHTLAGRSKDLASAAVLISLLVSAILWLMAFASLIK